MRVENTSKVQLTPNDIETLIVNHLKEIGALKTNEKFTLDFDVHIHHEDDYSLGGGYSKPIFDGCTVVINKN